MNEAAAKAKAKREERAKAAWKALNERQRAYLGAVYRADQKEEAWQRSAWSRGGRAAPAEVWRWILYGSPLVESSLRTRLELMGLVDKGTGATFAALADRGLFLRTRKGLKSVVLGPWAGRVEVLYVRMTTKGRAAVRAGTYEPPPEGCLPGETRLPAGTLKRWHWRALTRLREAGDAGLGYYGAGVGWRTWERLMQYGSLGYGPLARYRKEERAGDRDDVVVITPEGKRFCEERREEYVRRYADVAPARKG